MREEVSSSFASDDSSKDQSSLEGVVDKNVETVKTTKLKDGIPLQKQTTNWMVALKLQKNE